MRSKCLCVNDYYINFSSNSPTFNKDMWYEYTDQQFATRDYTEGFNVQFSNSEYIFFRILQDKSTIKGYGVFSTHFKTIKQIRKDKIIKING